MDLLQGVHRLHRSRFITSLPSSSQTPGPQGNTPWGTPRRRTTTCGLQRVVAYPKDPTILTKNTTAKHYGSSITANGDCLGTPNPYNLSEKYWRYTSNLYRSTLPICNAVPRWLQSFGERETPQYTSNLYSNTPPICTAVHLRFVLAILLSKYQGLGVPESS